MIIDSVLDITCMQDSDNQLINSYEYDGIARQFEEYLVIVNFRASNHTVVYLGQVISA